MLGAFGGVILIAMIVLVVLLKNRPGATVLPAALVLNQTTLPTGQPATAINTAASTTKQSASCQADSLVFFQAINPFIAEFLDTYKVASSTSRVALGPIIPIMQKDSRSISETLAPDCAVNARNLLVRGIDGVVNGFIDFLGSKPESVYVKEMEQGALDFKNASDQLSALTAGQPTPVPQLLPTNTPIPTARPT